MAVLTPPRQSSSRLPLLVRARRAVIFLAALLALVVLVAGCGDAERDEVTIQLNWFHEAEFAGYYMAQAQDFYSDAGLDVIILEGGTARPAIEKLVGKEVDFAITSFGEQVDMVNEGQPVVAVMAAFQIPPLVIFSLTDSDIRQPADLAGKKVGVTTDYWANVLQQTLVASGVDPESVEKVAVDTDALGLLYDGTVQAWLGYAQDEPIQAETAGYPVTSIYPADFGIGGYEGLLIVREQTITDDPDLVRRVVEATYQGWRYALEHPDEAAKVLNDLAPQNGLEFQQLAVRAVAPLVDTPQVPVGWIDAARWQQLMGEAYDPTRPGFTMEFSPVTP